MKQQLLPRGLSLPFLRPTANKRNREEAKQAEHAAFPRSSTGPEETKSSTGDGDLAGVVLTAAEVFTLPSGIIFAVCFTLFPFSFLSFSLFPLPFP